jgi:hypothetical protein
MSDTGGEPAPHFVQVGIDPVFIGDGPVDFRCVCGASVLVRGYRPAALLKVAMQCVRCGAVTTTDGLPAGEVLPFGVRVVERDRIEIATPITLTGNVTIGDREELARVEALCRPQPVTSVLLEVTPDALARLAADYDRLTGGQLAAHRAALPADGDTAAALRRLPLAWAFRQIEPNAPVPLWWCLEQEPDAVAAILLAGFQHFSATWSGHPLFDAMTASAALDGFSTHVLAPFAAAQCLVETGNRVAFTRPVPERPRIEGFHIESGPGERLAVLTRRLDCYDWPAAARAEPAVVRARAIDTLIATQAHINARRPGIVILSVGPVRGTDDLPILAGVRDALESRWRRHRGLLGAAVILPKVYPTDRSDRVSFGWTWLPVANPAQPGIVMATPGAGGNAASKAVQDPQLSAFDVR